MSSEGDGGSSAANYSVMVTVIPADNPEIGGRLIIQAQPDTTVGKLRRDIQGMIPTRPDIARLRLIHAGALLARDEVRLRDLVGEEELRTRRAVNVHLALRPGPDDPTRTLQAMQTFPVSANSTTAQDPSAPAPPLDPTSTLPAGQESGAPTNGQNASQNVSQDTSQNTPQQEEQRRLLHQQRILHQEAIRQHQAAVHRMMQHGFPGMVPPPVNAPGFGHGPVPHGPVPVIHAPGPLPAQDFPRQLNQVHIIRQGAQPPGGGPIHQQPQVGGAPALGGLNDRGFADAGPPWGGLPAPAGFPVLVRQGENVQMRLNHPIMPLGQPLHGGAASVEASFAGRPQSETIYLLASPEGYRAILMGPRQSFGPAALPRLPGIAGDPLQQTNDARVPVQGQRARQERAAAPRQIGLRDLVGILVPLGGPLWLLIRLTFVGSLMCWGATWTKTLLICLSFSIIFFWQLGLLGPVRDLGEQAWEPLRQHIDQLVRDFDHREAQPGQAAQPDGSEQPRQRQQREQSLVRRMERSVALFAASFFPGIGEAQVRAREEAERARRRAAEEREEQARREAEERAQAEGEGQAPTEVEKNDASSNSNSNNNSDPINVGSSTSAEDRAPGLRQRQPRVEDAADEDA